MPSLRRTERALNDPGRCQRGRGFSFWRWSNRLEGGERRAGTNGAWLRSTGVSSAPLRAVDLGVGLSAPTRRLHETGRDLPRRTRSGSASMTDDIHTKKQSSQRAGRGPGTLKARVEQLEAELAKSEGRSAAYRADFEREREPADHMVTAQDRLIAELEALRALLEAAQRPAQPVTPRTWRVSRHMGEINAPAARAESRRGILWRRARQPGCRAPDPPPRKLG